MEDKSLNLAPMTRKLKEVLINSNGIMRCKVQTIDEVLKTFAHETNVEYGDKIPFNESDGDEFESPDKALPLPATRKKLINRAKKQEKRLHKIKTQGEQGLNGNEGGKQDDDVDSYDSEIER